MVEKDNIVGNISSIFNKYTGKEDLEREINQLQSHIVELELDVKTANIRYEKNIESEKRAVAAKQKAEEKLKAAEVRIRTFEHELEKQRAEKPDDLSFYRVDLFSREKTLDFLQSLSSFRSISDQLLTVHVAAGENPDSIKDHEHIVEQVDSHTMVLMEKVVSPTGFVLFHSYDHLINEMIIPPLPLKKTDWDSGESFDTSEITESLKNDLNVCVLVAHAGESFVGYSTDLKDFDPSRVIRSSVKAKHAKGGFSQRRFERLRDEDIAHHIDKVKSALKDLLEEFEGSIDYLLIAGDQQLAKEITVDVPPDIEQVISSSDVRIEKHNTSDILKRVMTCRRYRL